MMIGKIPMPKDVRERMKKDLIGIEGLTDMKTIVEVYGPEYILRGLSLEEIKRVQKILTEKVRKAEFDRKR